MDESRIIATLIPKGGTSKLEIADEIYKQGSPEDDNLCLIYLLDDGSYHVREVTITGPDGSSYYLYKDKVIPEPKLFDTAHWSFFWKKVT